MTRLSISLGAGALPEVAAALEHAREHPTHDPVVFAEVTVEREGRAGHTRINHLGQRVWWFCYGEHAVGASYSLDPTTLCAKGGQP